ncbi:hypothetical protein IPA_02230 [Ignicoccus pacificus DSM 13166]|uniref:Uncharacterized protein n=1 Tax=Ignicoccus pacificus DSM 13166 TaxID=940294 RepID=A0A977KAP3_9CREN|nr:hypothetical protein IPA_02230 [Ignicoccus pacificus DSM 13166]
MIAVFVVLLVTLVMAYTSASTSNYSTFEYHFQMTWLLSPSTAPSPQQFLKSNVTLILYTNGCKLPKVVVSDVLGVLSRKVPLTKLKDSTIENAFSGIFKSTLNNILTSMLKQYPSLKKGDICLNPWNEVKGVKLVVETSHGTFSVG